MIYCKWVFVLCSLFFFFNNTKNFAQEQFDWKQEIQEIDEKIKQLDDLKEFYSSRIAEDSTNALRWEFQDENYPDARKAWERVEKDQNQLDQIENQIHNLQSKRAEILKKHGQ